MAKKSTAKKGKLSERLKENMEDVTAPTGPTEGDATDPELNAPIEDHAPAVGPITLNIGSDVPEPEDEPEEPLLIDAIENPPVPPEPDQRDPLDDLDELTLAKLIALKEKFGAKSFRFELKVKNHPQVFYMVDELGNDIAGGPLEDLAFLALTFEVAKPSEDDPRPHPDFAGPDPILSTMKRQPINSFHDLTIVLRDFGCKMTFDKVGDFYTVLIYDQDDMREPIIEGSVPINATKGDLTRLFYKAKPFFPKKR